MPDDLKSWRLCRAGPCLVFATFLTAFLGSQALLAESVDPALRVHVLTMDPGQDLFTRFGHIALIVEDVEEKTSKAYNFGTLDFADPALRLKYARGFLNYWLSISSYSRMVRRYRELERGATLRTLHLTTEQAQELARLLDVNALPENREYAYRHYLDNCCTRIRDVLDEVTRGAVSRGRDEEPTGRTFRYWTRRALRGLPLTGTVIQFSLGPAVDHPITRYHEQFLPEVLSEDSDRTRVGLAGQPLVSKRRQVLSHRGEPVGQSIPLVELLPLVFLFALLGLGLVLPIVLGPRRPLARRLVGVGLGIWGLLAGVLGLILTLFWAATQHLDTHWNENLLLFPIFHLWLVGPGIALVVRARIGRRTARILRLYLVAASALVLLDLLLKIGPFIQGNWEFVAFAALANSLSMTALVRTGSE